MMHLELAADSRDTAGLSGKGASEKRRRARTQRRPRPPTRRTGRTERGGVRGPAPGQLAHALYVRREFTLGWMRHGCMRWAIVFVSAVGGARSLGRVRARTRGRLRPEAGAGEGPKTKTDSQKLQRWSDLGSERKRVPFLSGKPSDSSVPLFLRPPS